MKLNFYSKFTRMEKLNSKGAKQNYLFITRKMLRFVKNIRTGVRINVLLSSYQIRDDIYQSKH
jgi:general stress protein 26